jgi:hypothetical protein
LRDLDKRDLADLVRAGLVDPEAVPPDVLEEARKMEAAAKRADQQRKEQPRVQPKPTPARKEKEVVQKRRSPRPPVTRTVFKGIVSRDDDRYPKEVKTLDGIIVKVRDTDEDPLDADMEIRVGHTEKEYDDLPTGAKIEGRGLSGRHYQLIIERIYDEEETVHFVLRRID